MPSLSLATGLLSQFDAAWTPNTTPDRAATKAQVMVLSPDRVIVGGCYRWRRQGVRNRKRAIGRKEIRQPSEKKPALALTVRRRKKESAKMLRRGMRPRATTT